MRNITHTGISKVGPIKVIKQVEKQKSQNIAVCQLLIVHDYRLHLIILFDNLFCLIQCIY
jgi:hypothetical protein